MINEAINLLSNVGILGAITAAAVIGIAWSLYERFTGRR